MGLRNSLREVSIVSLWLEFKEPKGPKGLQGWGRAGRLVWSGGKDFKNGPCDGGQRGVLRPLRQTGRGFQALLALQASLLLRGGVPDHGLEAPQEEVRATGASAGRRCENQRSTSNRGLAGGSEVAGAHGRAGGSSC